MLKTQSIDQLLSQAQVAIDNALNNPTILSALGDYGYTAARIQTGKKLYSEAAAAQIAQTAEAGGQISASATVNEAWETAKKSYIRFIKIARIAFKHDAGISIQLALSGTRKRTLSGWMGQATQFYKNAIANKVILSSFKNLASPSKSSKPDSLNSPLLKPLT